MVQVREVEAVVQTVTYGNNDEQIKRCTAEDENKADKHFHQLD